MKTIPSLVAEIADLVKNDNSGLRILHEELLSHGLTVPRGTQDEQHAIQQLKDEVKDRVASIMKLSKSLGALSRGCKLLAVEYTEDEH